MKKEEKINSLNSELISFKTTIKAIVSDSPSNKKNNYNNFKDVSLNTNSTSTSNIKKNEIQSKKISNNNVNSKKGSLPPKASYIKQK